MSEYKVLYETKVWESKNKNWAIMDRVLESESYTNMKSKTSFLTTMYIVQQENRLWSDWPIMYDDGTFSYDAPERIPQYVKRIYEKKMGYRRVQQEKLHRGNAVVGYFNWCDTLCASCFDKKHRDKDHIDWPSAAGFSELTHKDAVEDDGYWCDMCGKEFPEDVIANRPVPSQVN
jgi:hypothetical protein